MSWSDQVRQVFGSRFAGSSYRPIQPSEDAHSSCHPCILIVVRFRIHNDNVRERVRIRGRDRRNVVFIPVDDVDDLVGSLFKRL